MAKQSSRRMSSLAAKVLAMSKEEIANLDPSDVRSLAASVLSQDETPLKKLIKLLTFSN
jgi:hypothetical protein